MKEKHGFFEDIETFFVMLKATLSGKYKMSLGAYLWPVAFVLYLLSPIDMIPDFLVPLLGFGDDAAFFLFVTYRLRKEVKNYRLSIETPAPKQTEGRRLK